MARGELTGMHWRKWMKDCIEIELNWIDLTWFALNWIELNWIELHAWWMNELLNEWLNEGMNEWLNEGMNERVSEWMNEWINKSINQWINRFADLIFQKCSETLSFFYDFYVNSSSRYSPVHWLPTTFADRGPHPRKERPYFGDRKSHFTWKTQGVARESFKPEFTRSRPATLPNYLMIYLMMMMMMMWLTWWWECCKWQSSVT